MSTSETVSTVIIAYNSKAFIRDALDSVIAQTRPVDEIVVVEDGTDDGTAAIVAEYADHGVRYIHQENQGCAGARNTGIRATKGTYLALLDADDIWLPEKTEQQLALITGHPEVVLVAGNKIWWDIDQDVRKPFCYSERERAAIKHEIFVNNPIGNPSMTLIRRSALEQVGLFDREVTYGDDWECWMRLLTVGEVAFHGEPVIVYRWHGDNISQRNQAERMAFLQKIALRWIWQAAPLWYRPIAHLRMISKTRFQLAALADRDGDYGRHLRNAFLALATWPFDRPIEKAMRLGRAIIGNGAYRVLRDRFRPAGWQDRWMGQP